MKSFFRAFISYLTVLAFASSCFQQSASGPKAQRSVAQASYVGRDGTPIETPTNGRDWERGERGHSDHRDRTESCLEEAENYFHSQGESYSRSMARRLCLDSRSSEPLQCYLDLGSKTYLRKEERIEVCSKMRGDNSGECIERAMKQTYRGGFGLDLDQSMELCYQTVGSSALNCFQKATDRSYRGGAEMQTDRAIRLCSLADERSAEPVECFINAQRDSYRGGRGMSRDQAYETCLQEFSRGERGFENDMSMTFEVDKPSYSYVKTYYFTPRKKNPIQSVVFEAVEGVIAFKTIQVEIEEGYRTRTIDLLNDQQVWRFETNLRGEKRISSYSRGIDEQVAFFSFESPIVVKKVSVAMFSDRDGYDHSSSLVDLTLMNSRFRESRRGGRDGRHGRDDRDHRDDGGYGPSPLPPSPPVIQCLDSRNGIRDLGEVWTEETDLTYRKASCVGDKEIQFAKRQKFTCTEVRGLGKTQALSGVELVPTGRFKGHCDCQYKGGILKYKASESQEAKGFIDKRDSSTCFEDSYVKKTYKKVIVTRCENDRNGDAKIERSEVAGDFVREDRSRCMAIPKNCTEEGYFKAREDVRKARVKAADHWKNFGRTEYKGGRFKSACIPVSEGNGKSCDTTQYRAQYPDRLNRIKGKSGIGNHFNKIGRFENKCKPRT